MTSNVDTPGLTKRQILIATSAVVAVSRAADAAPAKLSIRVYKDPSCGCCTGWVEKLRQAGFLTTTTETADMAAVKSRLRVPDDLASCHTGIIKGLVIEGHIPPSDVRKFVLQNRKSLGIAVPGMPTNSPGMEVPGAPSEPYTVWEFFADGSRKPFAKHA